MKSSKDKDLREKISILLTKFSQSKTARRSHIALSWVLGAAIKGASSRMVSSQKETSITVFLH